MPGRDTLTTGDLGEQLAADYLQQHGYRLLCRNFRYPCGEIDIIAEREGVIYFVEVKSRNKSTFAPPAANVTRTKRRQISRAAALWFAKQGYELPSGLLIAEVYLDSGNIHLLEDFLL